MERTDLIAMLGVSASPTTGEVRRARRTVARLLHPDAQTHSPTLMAEINAACDEWLAEIRSRRDRPVSPGAPAVERRHTAHATAQGDKPRQHRETALAVLSAIAFAVLLAGLVARLVTGSSGASLTALAAGTLLGLGAAGLGAAVVLIRRERRRTR